MDRRGVWVVTTQQSSLSGLSPVRVVMTVWILMTFKVVTIVRAVRIVPDGKFQPAYLHKNLTTSAYFL